MNKMLEPMLSEFREEAKITRRVLDRVPADKLAWRPHPKSMSLGQLALHIASIPGGTSKLAQLEEFDASQAAFDPPAADDLKQIHAAFDQSVRSAEECLGRHDGRGGGGKLASDFSRKRSLHPTACRSPTVSHVQPLVPPPGATIGVSPVAGSAGPGDLRPQLRREPVP